MKAAPSISSRAKKTPIPATNAPDIRTDTAVASLAFQIVIATKPVNITIKYCIIPRPKRYPIRTVLPTAISCPAIEAPNAEP